MAQMKLEIGGRTFMVTCQDGEESHLTKLATMVDEKTRESGDPSSLTESRMLLFTSLLLADDLHNAQAASTPISDQVVAALEKLADRTEQLANSLE